MNPQELSLIPRAILFGNPERANPQLSMDGHRLAFLAPDESGVLNVWVRNRGSRDDRMVTSDRQRGIRFFTWRFDGEHILYIQDKEGDENWRLYQSSLETKETRDLTPFEEVQVQLVAYEPKFPGKMLVALNLRDRRLHDVYSLNLDTGAVELEAENPGDINDWKADHELRVRATASLKPDGGTILRVRDDEGLPWRTLMEWGPDETFGRVQGFTPDDSGLWVISSVDSNAARLLEIDLSSSVVKLIAEDPNYDVAGTMLHPQTHELEAVHFIRDRSEWRLIEQGLADDFQVIRDLDDGDFSVVSRDLKDCFWLVRFVKDNGPVQYFTFDRTEKKADFLFSNRPQLEHYSLAPMRPISFEARDGMTIHGYLTLPPGAELRNLPLVLNVHGGPWTRDVWGLHNEVQWLANRGYAVLQVNFRGSTGYGKDYLNAGDREWAAKMHDDLIDGKNWAVRQGCVDVDRVAIYGGSYGGYAALVGLTFTPEEFTCAVDVVGPSNLITLIQSIPPYWVPMRSIFDKRVGKVESEAEFLESRSPLFQAHRITRPLLIAQGANDPRVKQAESDQIVAEMRRNGQQVEYLVFPDEGHGFARPENRLTFYAAAEQFLSMYLGGRSEPPQDGERWEHLRR